jgi:hypothetical protein
MKEPSIFKMLARDQPSKTIYGISLMARVGFGEDVAACCTLHRLLGLPYSGALCRALPAMWHAMLSKGTMKIFLVEDRARPLGSRIVSFNAILFVTDEFCLDARSTLHPYLSVELVQRYLSGRLPVLNREQIARANARGGLNVVMCFEGYAHHGLSRERLLAVHEKQSEAFHLALSGYRVKEFLADPVGPETSRRMLEAGARVRRKYSNYFRKTEVPDAEFPRRPRLVGLTKEEAFAHPGSYLANLFVYTAPRFHFNRSQRMLLQHALMGETCEMLATSLSLSPWTVKKRWHAIYQRVADVDSELLPPAIAYGAHTSSRGAERRRHLLYYLRQHLEELRPYEPKRRMARIEARRLGNS